jgi:hypothetical protein
VLNSEDLEDVLDHSIFPKLGKNVALIVVQPHAYKNPKEYAVDK